MLLHYKTSQHMPDRLGVFLRHVWPSAEGLS